MYEGIDTEITRNLNETDLKIIDNIMNDPNGSSIQAPSESPRNVASPGPVYDPYQQPSTSKGPMLGEPNLPKTLHHPLLENSPTPYENIEQVNQPGGTSGYIMDLPEIGNPLHGIPDQDLPVLNADDINNFLSHVQEDNRTNQKAEISSCPQHVLPEKRKSRISIVLENPEDKSQQRIVIPSSVKAIGLKQGAVLSISPKPVARTSQTTPAEPGTSRQAISASQQCVCQQAAGDQGTFKVHVKADSSKIKVPTSLNFNENGPVFTADIEEQLNRLMTKSRTVAQINKAAYEMNIKPIDAWTWYVKTNLIGLAEKAID